MLLISPGKYPTKAGNRLGYGPTTTLTVSTLSIDSDGDGVPDDEDDFPDDASETTDTDGDGVGDNTDAFPNDASESTDSDGDGLGNNTDTDDDGDGFSDQEELAEGSDPLDSASVPEESGGLPKWMFYLTIKPNVE